MRNGYVGIGIFSELLQKIQFYRGGCDACCPREFRSLFSHSVHMISNSKKKVLEMGRTRELWESFWRVLANKVSHLLW